MRQALDKGADKLKVEGREGGINIGLFDEEGKIIRPMLSEYLERMEALRVPRDEVIWEAR